MARIQTVESVVKSDIEELGDLSGIEPSLAATALVIAKAIDKAVIEDPRSVAALSRELRITLKALTDACGPDEGDDDDLATPA